MSETAPAPPSHTDDPSAPETEADGRSAGERLRAAREALGQSIDEVEAAIHVRAAILEGVEAMDMRRLPAGPYVAGFVRAYARHVGLDPGAIDAQFRAETAPRASKPRVTAAPVRKPVGAPVRPIAAALAALILIVVVAITLSTRRAPPIDEVEPVSDALRVWLREDPGADAFTPAPGAAVSLIARTPTTVRVQAASGRIFFDGPLARGARLDLPQLAGLRVDAANAGAVEVVLDGEAAGRLGPSATPVSAWDVDAARQGVPDAGVRDPGAPNPGAPNPSATP